MKKRFLGVLLSVAMVAAVLAGCGSSGAKETAATDVAAKYADYMEYKYASNTTNPGAASTFTAWLGTNKLTSTDTTKYTVSEDSVTITIVPRDNANKQVTGTIEDTGAITWNTPA